MYEEVKEDLKKICLEEDYQVEADKFLDKFVGDVNTPSVYTAEEDSRRNAAFLNFIKRWENKF